MQTSRKKEDEKKQRQLEEEQERTIIQFNRTCDTIS